MQTVVTCTRFGRLRTSIGFTLIELMIVLTIAGILMVVGIPMLTDFVADQRVRTVASDINSEIAFARAKAIEASRRVYIQRTGANWNNGWRIYIDNNNNAAFDAGDEEVKVFNGFPPGNVYVCSNVADFAAQVAFRPDGRVVRTVAAGANDGIYIVDTRADVDPSNNKVRGLLFGVSGRAAAVNLKGTVPPC